MVVTVDKSYQLINVIEKIKDLEMSLSTKYKLILIENEAIKQKEITTPIIRDLFLKNGKLDEETKTITVDEDKRQAVEDELVKLYAQQITFPDIYFSIEELPNIYFDDLKVLMDFIK